MITRVHPNHRALGFVSDLRGNMKIIGNYAYIFVVPAQIYCDNQTFSTWILESSILSGITCLRRAQLDSPGVLICIDIAGLHPWCTKSDSAWESALLVYFSGYQDTGSLLRIGHIQGFSKREKWVEIQESIRNRKKKLNAVSSKRRFYFHN